METAVSISQKIEYEELPEDLFIDILSRLPVKTLLRFKSVCKRWYSLIQNPNFISLHFTRARPSYCASLLCTDPNNNPRFHLLFDKTSVHDLDLSFPRPDHLFPSMSYKYCGSCYGLICLSSSSDIVIFNPATKECRQLPQPPYGTCPTRYVGFAYDSKTNDYKVVRVVATCKITLDDKIQIYSMSADSWKEIASMMSNHDCILYCQPCMSLDGIFYWLSYDYRTHVHGIDALNTIEGLFERRSLPIDVTTNIREIGLCLLDDSIAIVVPKYSNQQGETQFGIWLMDKYGLEGFWIKKYTIGPPLGNLIPFGFVLNSDILLTWNEYGKIVSYHHITHCIEEFKQLCGLPNRRITKVFPYSESLVSVKR